MTEETFEIRAGGFTAGEIDVALSLATDGHFVDIATASMALSGISFLKERWEYRNMELTETIQHYEVLIANQSAFVANLPEGKRRDAEQLKLNNLRAELEMVKAQ